MSIDPTAVLSGLVAYMGKREIKFSLGTSDPELAGIRFMEENAKLERHWHEYLHGRQYVEVSQRQISALAGEFYREMVAIHSNRHPSAAPEASAPTSQCQQFSRPGRRPGRPSTFRQLRR